MMKSDTPIEYGYNIAFMVLKKIFTHKYMLG